MSSKTPSSSPIQLTEPAWPLLVDLARRALEEDLYGGDLTTEATVEARTRGTALGVARSPLVACGFGMVKAVYSCLDVNLELTQQCPDGQVVAPGTQLFRVSGAARSILMGERCALNFMQRMSGIATLTRSYVEALPAASRCRIADTRKTTPGLRVLERYAVRAGGAHNHRDNLGSAILIKDNHIVAAGGIGAALDRARARAPHTSRLEIEVETLEQLGEALAGGADIVMLDNFAPEQIASAVAMCQGRAITEVSGGITLERVTSLALAGVDVISVGALTHSARAADISLDLELT